MKPRLQTNFLGKSYMPINLKSTLMRYGIKQPDWCKNVIQKTGVPLSLSAGNQLVNWNTWPTQTDSQTIKTQTEDYLRSRKVPEVELVRLWDEDEGDDMRGAHPVGIHEGQYNRHIKAELQDDLIGEPEMLSPNAKKHFGLFRSPFVEDVGGPEDVFISPDIRYIRESMYATAKHGGLLAVIGESGSGKSTLRKDLLDRIGKENDQIIVIFPRVVDKTRLNAGSICEAIIKDLRPDAKLPQSLESKARLVESYLKSSSDAGNKHVLMVEEAHDITIPCLKLFKRFFEIEDGFRKLLSVVLIGQPELGYKLNEANYPDAREFIRRCEVAHLAPLDHNLEEYVQFKFKRVGKDAADIFEKDSFDAIRHTLKSKRFIAVPLLVNLIITKALNLAAEIGEPKITAEVISQL